MIPTALILVCSTLLTGCGGNSGSTKSSTGSSSTTTNTLPEAKLTWYFPGNFPQVDQDLVFAEVNKGIKAKINATVDFKPLGFGDYDQKMQVTIASGENYDLCFTSNWVNNYVQNVSKGAFLPLDDLLAKDAPKTFASVPASFWTAAKVKGKIYGVINQQISARVPALSLSTASVNKYKLDLNALSGNINANSLNLLEPFIQACHKDNPDSFAGLDISALEGYFFGMDLPAGWKCPAGVAFSDSSMKVVNFYETADFKTYAKTMRDWNAKGYMNSKLRITLKSDDTIEMKKMGGFTIGGTYKPGGDIGASVALGIPTSEIPVGKAFLTTGGIVATMHAISRNSKNPDRAMMLLELLNTDKDLYNTLNFGIKDKHYTIDADGFMVKSGDAAKAYTPNVPWMFATNFLANIDKGMPKTVWEDTKKINASATPSPLLGFNFDTEKVKGEVGQCSAVVDEYSRSIELGVSDESKYNEFLAKIKTAGSEKIIAEMQSQIDAWKASK